MAKTLLSPAARKKIRAFSNTTPRDGSLESALDLGYRLGVIVMWDRMTLTQRREWMEWSAGAILLTRDRRARLLHEWGSPTELHSSKEPRFGGAFLFGHDSLSSFAQGSG